MSDFFVSLNTQSTVLTEQTLREAMRQLSENQARVDAERDGQVRRLLESLPVHARSHLFIQTLVGAVLGGAIFHPNDAKAIHAEVERISHLSSEECAAEAGLRGQS